MLLFLCALSVACQPSGTPPLPAEQPPPASDVLTLRGHYMFGFEVSAFSPCHSIAWWWGSKTSEKVWAFIQGSPEYAPRTGSYPFPEGEIYVHWRGERSPEGRYGHLGSYPREFKVLELYEVHAATPQDCL